jgi:hypothetical protein
LHKGFNIGFGIFRLVNFPIECLCMASLTLVVMVMSGLVFHPLFCIALMSGSYLVSFCVMACYGNLSWQYVNSMSWTMVVGDGVMGVCVWFGAPIMYRTPSLSLARHWHGVCEHVHLNSQFGIVWSGGLLLIFLVLVSVKKGRFF